MKHKVNENTLHLKQAGNIFELTLYIAKHKQHQILEEKRLAPAAGCPPVPNATFGRGRAIGSKSLFSFSYRGDGTGNAIDILLKLEGDWQSDKKVI